MSPERSGQPDTRASPLLAPTSKDLPVGREPNQPPDLSSRLGERLRRRHSSVAIVWDETEITYQQLDAWSAALTAELRSAGIKAGDRVAVGLPNSPLLVATVLAVVRSGAVLVPLNPSGPAADARFAVTHSQAHLAVLSPSRRDAWGDLGCGALVPNEHLLEANGTVEWTARQGADAALLMYTSGTTGRPKGVVLSHASVAGNLATVAKAWRWTESDRLLLTLPCFHLHGLALGILGSLLVGSRIVLRNRFVAEDVPGLIEAQCCTLFFGVPTMYNRLVQLPEPAHSAPSLASMRLWVSGSAPLTPATFESFQDQYGHEILERFGMSEGGFMIAAPFEGPRRPGVVGVPLPGIDIRIFDPDAENDSVVDVAIGEVGEIAIRGANLFTRYWRDPDATAKAFRGPYFCSGDLALREDDGMIRIVGRISVDVIKCRGFKIGAIEIENCLQAHADIAEVAVVGVPHPDLGEEIVAVVTRRDGSSLTGEAVLAHARRELAGHKTPGRVVFLTEIPRTGPGKFRKRELIDRLQQGDLGTEAG